MAKRMRRMLVVGLFVGVSTLGACIDNSSWIRIADRPVMRHTQPAENESPEGGEQCPAPTEAMRM